MPHAESLASHGKGGPYELEGARGASSAFAKFVASATLKDLTPAMMKQLRILLVDWIAVVALAAKVGDSTPTFLKAFKSLTTGASGASGATTVVGSDIKMPKQYAAMMNGAYAHTLDFDDTYQPGIVHPGASVIAAVLAEVEGQPEIKLDQALLAMAVGYETVCRIAAAMGRGTWERGSHNTSTAGMYGCIAALAKLRKFDAATTETAFGTGTSFISSSLQFLVNGKC